MSTDRPEVREIITKAVCGHGTYKYQRSIDLEVPVGQESIQVLGTFVSNAGLEEAAVVDDPSLGQAVKVKGHYDVHVWYAPEQETRSAKTTVTFIEFIPIKMMDAKNVSNPQAIASLVHKPRCRKAYVKELGDKSVIRVEIEQDIASEVVGLTKIRVGTGSPVNLNKGPVWGLELLPPTSPVLETQSSNFFFELKCDEDLPEDEEDFDYLRNEYNG